jgi:DNA processing protein
VPGQIDRPTSAGTNRLIQQGARLVTSADDILDELGTLIPRGTSGPLSGKSARTGATDPAPAPALSHDETLLITALQVGELTVDELSQATRLPLGKISGTLLSLEMKRLIRALPGHRYARV